MKTIIEPFRIKSVDPIRMTTPRQRLECLRRAEYNLFRIAADDVIVDLLTDSGTGAMSSDQWAGIMRGDESYAGAHSYYRFLDEVERLTGMRHILPTHQGRASERILVEVMIGPAGAGRGKVVPNNAHFDTTRANIEHSGAEAIDLLTDEGARPEVIALFKGNMDVAKLQRLLGERAGDVPFVMVTITCNSNGGQPVSMANLRQVRAACDRHGVPLFLDACRFAENAWFIRTREVGYADVPPRAIVRQMFDLADGATISAKKDGLVNIGGVLLMRDEAAFRRASNLLILTEGFVTYGGLAGRDLEAMAVGFEEVLSEDYLRYRIRSTEYLGEKLREGGVGIVEPPGGHAVYIDAAAFCPHIPAHQFPGQAVACALYEHGGIRSCEIGSVMMGEHAVMELVRLAVPRRTYTQSHIDYVIEVVLEVRKHAANLRGMRIIEPADTPDAPKVPDAPKAPDAPKPADTLRHFTARFAPL